MSLQLEKLLADVTQLPPGTTRRQQHLKLTELLQERHGEAAITYKGVAKWFDRKSIPATWLLRIAQLPPEPLNLAHYAA